MTTDSETQADSENPNIRQMREQLKAATEEAKAAGELKSQLAEAQAALNAAQRTAAFAQAGFDPEDPKHKYFVTGYQGDLTPDAIKLEAQSIGLATQASQPNPGQGIDEAMASGEAPKPSNVPDQLLAKLEELKNAQGPIEHRAIFSDLAAIAGADSAFAAENGGYFADDSDITNRPNLMSLRDAGLIN